jgi:hypothetical protein
MSTINDDAKEFLTTDGYVGSLGEQMYAYFKEGESTIAVMLGGAAATYWDGLANP